MGLGGPGGRVLKVVSCIDALTLALPELAIQVAPSSLDELLSDAARAGRTLIRVGDGELAGLLRSIVGGASLVEGGPSIGEEFFYLVGLRRRGGVPAGMEDVVVFRCVAARGVWL
jgi:hypothetical protein